MSRHNSVPIHTLTKSEFFDLVDPKRERHDDDAYSDNDLERIDRLTKSMNSMDKLELEDVGRFDVHGIRFKLVRTIEDRVKRDAYKRGINDEGYEDYLRDDSGELVPMSDLEKLEEIEKNGWSRYKYEHRIYEESTGKCVANTQDEYGCLLFYSAKEYAGFGLGQRLMEADFAVNGYRHSGGYTPSGFNSTDLFYDNQIRKALANGEFSKMVRSGEKNISEVRELLTQANVINWYKDIDPEEIKKYSWYYNTKSRAHNGLSIDEAIQHANFLPRKHSRCKLPDRADKKDYTFGKVKDMLLCTDGNYAILYDRKIYDLMQDESHMNRHGTDFVDKAILGYVYVGGVYDPNETPRLFGLYAKSEPLEKFMHQVALSLYEGDELRLTPEQRAVVRSMNLDGVNERDDLDRSYVSLDKASIDINGMTKLERAYRAIHGDRYDENHVMIQERAYALAEYAKNEVRHYKPKPHELENKVKASPFAKSLVRAVTSDSLQSLVTNEQTSPARRKSAAPRAPF